MNKWNSYWKRLRLSLIFALIFSFTMSFAMLLVLAGVFLLDRLGFSDNKLDHMPLLLFTIVCLLIGTIISVFFSRRPLAPLREIMQATEKIAGGDYNARLHLKGLNELKQLSNSFNHMAEEIGSVEMLRSDFVNNFSHEFKTPIVSIRGFAKLLKRNDLTEEERNEYLDIIISEAERLSTLSTNVLNLSKIEKQTILTETNRFNVSEQIRLVITLLDQKWSDKHIDLDLICEEIFLVGNEELLRQVWINLLDNAIKFSPDYGTITIRIVLQTDTVRFSITDQGQGMSPETANRIFDKFYQGDTSHAEKGNGIGLTIAKHIVELHHGRISVQSIRNVGTTFDIVLPLGTLLVKQ